MEAGDSAVVEAGAEAGAVVVASIDFGTTSFAVREAET